MFNTAHFHPMLVHFPLALITLGFVVELTTWYYKKETWLPKASMILILLGTLGAIAAYLSGTFFTNDLSGEAGAVKESHELFAKFTMGIMILLSIISLFLYLTKKENKNLRILVTTLYAIGAGLVGYTGYLGGTLVINYLIGL